MVQPLRVITDCRLQSPAPREGDMSEDKICGDAVGGKSLSHVAELGVKPMIEQTPHFRVDRSFSPHRMGLRSSDASRRGFNGWSCMLTLNAVRLHDVQTSL